MSQGPQVSLAAYSDDFDNRYYGRSARVEGRRSRQTDPSGNSFLVSTGPYLMDGNHAPPTRGGYLNLIAGGYTPYLLSSDLVNLDDATFSFRISSDNFSTPNSDIYFWFSCL